MTGGKSLAMHLFDTAPASALAVAAGIAVIVPFVTLGGVSSHMVLHIAMMNVAAPLLAAAWVQLASRDSVSSYTFWAATASQIGMLWAWHLPSAHHLASSSVLGAATMHASLLGVAIWFWSSLIRLRLPQLWQGILALLVTGKLACLLGGLLVFATRPVFHHHHDMLGTLDDQQLAGLLMIVACPASYVLAGVLMAVRFIGVFDARPEFRSE